MYDYIYVYTTSCMYSSINSTIILEVHRINYMKYFCTYVIQGIVHVVEICMCSEFAVSAVHAYLCSVGTGWVGIVMVSLG
jgi:hypothetical protein